MLRYDTLRLVRYGKTPRAAAQRPATATRGHFIINRFHRNRVIRWGLRLCFALIASETTLALSARVIERNAGAAGVMPGHDGAIICAGDSHTFGIGASEGRSYPDQLRERLRAADDLREVVNIGFSGLTTHQIMARLRAAIAKSTPACVVFLGGHNDLYRGDTLLEVGAIGTGWWTRGRALLSRLRTIRLIEAGIRIVMGDAARPEYGGASEQLAEPFSVTPDQWDAEYARAEAIGGKALFPWVRFFFGHEYPGRASRALEAFVRTDEYARTQHELLYPIDDYRWELAMLSGASPPALSLARRTGASLDYARFTAAFVELREGHTAQAIALLDSLKPQFTGPWASAFLALHRVWAALIDRDFGSADREFDALLPQLEDISPNVGIYFALGGAALAHVLRSDEVRLEPWLAHHGIWAERYWWPQCPQGHEWMFTAEWVDTVKGGDATALDRLRGMVKSRVGAVPSTAPLAWLVDHPRATFSEIVKQLPIEILRASWFGPLGPFYRTIDATEADRLMKPVFEELTRSARTGKFQVLLLTYLDSQSSANNTLRRFARDFELPIVDMQRVYAVDEHRADDLRKYFSADRCHPNEVGYGLMAKAVYEELRQRGLVH